MNQSDRLTIFLFTLSVAVLTVCSAQARDTKQLNSTNLELIDRKMDDFHDAADKGDKARYLGHFAENSVFMGTDDWERWSYEAFSKYVNQHFKGGKGWSYKPIKRYTNLNAQNTFAWVDEIVVSDKWGRFRGTAVLVNTDQGWQLKHYSLSKLVPNEVWAEVSGITEKAFDARGIEAGLEPRMK